MSLDVPENMEEVAMKIAQYQVHGQHLEMDDVIKDAVRDTLQEFMDEALEGHYDDVAWAGENLVVTDIMGEKIGMAAPIRDSFIEDFKTDADELVLRLEQQAAQIVGGR